ncbi:MAG: helix-turn-helix transcriptional regulator, partial [Streptococcus thermophilus]
MNRLKELRQSKKKTQQEMADIVGVTKRTYIYWEQGERQIKPEKAKVLA